MTELEVEKIIAQNGDFINSSDEIKNFADTIQTLTSFTTPLIMKCMKHLSYQKQFLS